MGIAGRLPSSHLETSVDHGFFASRIDAQTGVSFLAADVRSPDGGHEELLVVRVELDFEIALQVLLFPQGSRPPSVDVVGQLGGHRVRLFVGVGALEPDKNRIRVPVDDLVAALFHEVPRDLHHLMAAQVDR
ncbi:hypothetical protein SDC9_117231 [bioreactor metagenome]|uniref:Uncharacterized protein n=1 Tax=bioreactor metagenome TaxID=1076179 RepID=A0A645BXM8_9ZZZZ